MTANRGAGRRVALYLPYYRRVLLRTAAAWAVLRLLLSGLQHELADAAPGLAGAGAGLHPLAALGLIAFVIAIDAVHARAMRESLFRANAGIAATAVALSVAGLLVSLELLVRVIS